jgi:hypothetical protein
LDHPNSQYIHHIFNHGRGQLGNGLDSTIRIEGVWGEIKYYIKKLYVSIHSKNFVYFLKEEEYSRATKNMSPDDKLKFFASIVSVNLLDYKFDLLNKEELSSINYDTYYYDDQI